MQRNLMIKVLVIVATVLVCIVGIIGFPTSMNGLKANVAKNIRLGLDLKGGSHLVLQVQVQDAAKTIADQTIDGLREDARTRNIIIAGYDRNDPATLADTNSIQVNIHGVDVAKTQIFRNLVTERYPDWILTPVDTNNYRMNMKPTSLLELKRNTVRTRPHRQARQQARPHRTHSTGPWRPRHRLRDPCGTPRRG